jgi:Zn-dependent protease
MPITNLNLRFRIARFPVDVHPSFFIMAVLLALGRTDVRLILAWVGVVFVSILIHELGHAVVGYAFGLSPRIYLYAMGGLTSWSTGRSLTEQRSILVSLAGPFAGLLVGSLIWTLVSYHPFELTPLGEVAVRDLLWANVGWSLLNLLPVLPLDGGGVMRSLVHMAKGYRNDRLPRQVSVVVGGAAAVVAILYGMMWAAFLAAWLAYGNYAALKGAPTATLPGMPRI